MSQIIISTYPMDSLTKGIKLSQQSNQNTTLCHTWPVIVSVQYSIAQCPSFPAQPVYR